MPVAVDNSASAASAGSPNWPLLGRHLTALVGRKIGNAHDVEDVVQEILVKIHNHLGGLRQAEKLLPWVNRIARHAIADYYRARRSESPLPPEVPDPAPVQRENPLPEEIAGWLGGFVEALPESYREAVRLSELEGLPHKSVASRLGLSLPATKSRIRRGRIKLHALLLECCHFEFDQRGTVIGVHPNHCDCGNGNCRAASRG